jgi:hypothetical protein
VVYSDLLYAIRRTSSAVQDLIYLILVTAILIGTDGLGKALAKL